MSTEPLLPEPVVLLLKKLEEHGELLPRDLDEEERLAAEFGRIADPPLIQTTRNISTDSDQLDGPGEPAAFSMTDAGRHALAYARFGERITGDGTGIRVYSPEDAPTDEEIRAESLEAKRLQDEILGPDPDELPEST